MTQDVETELVLAMRDQVAGIDPAEAQSILARALLDHRRSRRRGQVLAITAATGTAAALLVGVTLALTGVGPAASVQPAGQRSEGAPVPRVSAAQTSYWVTVLNTSRWEGRAQVETLADYTGSYDPVQQAGQGLRSTKRSGRPQDERIRLLDGTIYLQSDANTWRHVQGTIVDALVLDGGRRWGPWDGRSADSRLLLATLKARGALRLTAGTGTGAAALDHYTFGYTIAGDDSVSAHLMTGTVAVHRQSGLIAELTQRTTVVGANPEIADSNKLTFSTKVTFSNYGVPVRVTKP
jgi:hypothetical protein